MDIEIQSQHKLTKEITHLLVRDVPEEVTQGELRRYFALYAGPDQEYHGFNKVVFDNQNETW